MKKIFFFIAFIVYTSATGFSEDITYTQVKTVNLDINVSKIRVIIEPFDGASIAYRFDLTRGKKLSCIETYHTLRIRNITPAEGTLYLFIPKKRIVESCRIHLSQAAASIEGMQAIHFLLTVNDGSVTITNSVLKTALLTAARSTLVFGSEIVGAAAFSMSSSSADITFYGASSLYNLDYMHTNTQFSIDSMVYEKQTGTYGNQKSKRRLIFSASSSCAAIQFSPQDSSDTIENQYKVLQ